MNEGLRAFGRAMASLLHPRMLWLTLLPFLLSCLFWGAVLYVSWEPVVAQARLLLEGWLVTRWIYAMLSWLGLAHLQIVVAPLVVVSLLVPVIAVSVLLYIATVSMPTVMRHLASRHYPQLVYLEGGSFWGSMWNSTSATVLFLIMSLLTLPLWLLPPFFALIPPLLWGWLTYRVMAYDALASHASAEERRVLLQQHRLPLLTLGVVCGLLGAMPTFFWVTSALAIVLFPFVMLVSLWLYVVIFVFSGLWFGHYCLQALLQLRAVSVGPTGSVDDISGSVHTSAKSAALPSLPLQP